MWNTPCGWKMRRLELTGDALPLASRLDVSRQLGKRGSICKLYLGILVMLSCLKLSAMPSNMTIIVTIETFWSTLCIPCGQCSAGSHLRILNVNVHGYGIGLHWVAVCNWLRDKGNRSIRVCRGLNTLCDLNCSMERGWTLISNPSRDFMMEARPEKK